MATYSPYIAFLALIFINYILLRGLFFKQHHFRGTTVVCSQQDKPILFWTYKVVILSY